MTAFLHDLADLMRASDPFGRFDRFGDEQLLRPYVRDVAARADLGASCEIDPMTVERLRAFYQAVACGIERACGAMITVVVDVNHEGFGRAVVLAGHLVLLLEPVRDAQRFGFGDLAALADAGEARVARGLAAFEKFPEVTRADL